MADKNKYWHDREEEALKHYVRDEAEYDKRINQIYSDMLDGIQNEINGFYGKYADKEGISLAEAKKRVSKLDIKAYERKAARYVRDASLDRKVNAGKTNRGGYYFSENANEEMRLYNATMKINRLEMLKANIGLEMIKGHAELEAFMDEILQGRTMEELERQAGILGKSIRSNAKAANALVNASFHNATFSDRVWQYHDLMKADLSKLLRQGLVQGKGARELARDIKKYVNPDAKGGARYNAERLMRTELARVQTEAQMQSFRRNGFDLYTFITNSGCCEKCQKLNGKHFAVEDHEIALNAPPLHPHCRCSTAAYEDSDEFDAWLDYLAEGGTTESWEEAKKGIGKDMSAQTQTKWPKPGEKVSREDYKKIMEHADKRGIRLAGFKSFDGDPETIIELIDDAESVAKDFPNVKTGSRKLTISLSNFLPDDDFAETNGHIISINANAFRDKDRLAFEYKKSADSGWFVSGTDYRSIIKHEVGHVIAEKYKIDSIAIGKECAGTTDATELLSFVEKNLSEYSASFADGSEIIAECFASAYGNGKPNKFSLQFVAACAKMAL